MIRMTKFSCIKQSLYLPFSIDPYSHYLCILYDIKMIFVLGQQDIKLEDAKSLTFLGFFCCACSALDLFSSLVAAHSL